MTVTPIPIPKTVNDEGVHFLLYHLLDQASPIGSKHSKSMLHWFNRFYLQRRHVHRGGAAILSVTG